ncbi:11984_t:CDS:2, partial [Cetraspora pellucida]
PDPESERFQYGVQPIIPIKDTQTTTPGNGDTKYNPSANDETIQQHDSKKKDWLIKERKNRFKKKKSYTYQYGMKTIQRRDCEKKTAYKLKDGINIRRFQQTASTKANTQCNVTALTYDDSKEQHQLE